MNRRQITEKFNAKLPKIEIIIFVLIDEWQTVPRSIKSPAFKMILIATGEYAYRRPEEVVFHRVCQLKPSWIPNGNFNPCICHFASRFSRCVTSGRKSAFHALSAPDLSHQEMPNLPSRPLCGTFRFSRSITSGWKTAFHSLFAPDVWHQEEPNSKCQGIKWVVEGPGAKRCCAG